jgi:membrane protein implicated in regulation of membrane protease activity
MYAAIIAALDVAIIVAALASAWLWWRASRQRLRRISRNEVLDHADINRIVIAMNRTQILNSQGALATAIAALLAGLRLGVN